MEWLRKVTDWIMPLETVNDEESEREEVKQSASTSTAKKIEMPAVSASSTSTSTESTVESELGAVRKVSAMGGGYGSAIKFSEPAPSPSSAPAAVRPPLTVIDTKARELNVKIYAPTSFDQAGEIAAEILSKNAAVVNYDYVDAAVQLRLCDFLNGVCYVTDGFTDKISEKIFLYVPDGVETADLAETVTTINNAQFRRGMFAS